jgi:hypothetical protein
MESERAAATAKGPKPAAHSAGKYWPMPSAWSRAGTRGKRRTLFSLLFSPTIGDRYRRSPLVPVGALSGLADHQRD